MNELNVIQAEQSTSLTITLAEPPAWALTQYLNMMEERALGEENE